MAKIKAIDMRLLLEDIFASRKNGRGYVLDFSDRTFFEFFRDELSINIGDQKYYQNGTSKGNRLRTFLQIEPEPLVVRALLALWDYRNAIYLPSDPGDSKAKRSEV